LKRQPALTQPLFLIGKFAQMLDDAKDSLLHSLEKKVQEKRLKFAALQRAVQTQTPQARFKQLREKLSFTAAHLKAINPKNLLTKGYAILFDEKTGSAILSGKNLKKEERVRILMQDGILKATVNEYVPKTDL
jgi:exodeoxyribonuclease VII large subunit